MPNATFHFPPDFRWGVATAAHQVEGENTNNQWYTWEQEEGRIKQGHHSGKACNWWRNIEGDFDRAAAMGLNALRLSVEWSRIEPQEGYLDTNALDRYRAMLQSLRDRNIEPMITLHHFSDPLWITAKGGWENEEIVEYFSRFVEHTVQALGDFTTLWCTINEPNVYAFMGYLRGVFPPGKHDLQLTFKVLANMLKAHAAAYRVIHRVQPDARVGYAHNLRFFDPLNPKSLADWAVAKIQDLAVNETSLLPLRKGWWIPPMGYGPALSMHHTLDWIGLNYYTRDRIVFDKNLPGDAYGRATHTPGAELLDGNYGEYYPEGMYRALMRLADFNVPIYVTENGIPDSDDNQRPRALLMHLHQMWKALQNRPDIKGYYHWTLVDNFEWAEGWTLPFGLIELEPESGKRRPRLSSDLYTAIVRSNAITPELIDAYAPEVRPLLLPGYPN